MTPSPILKVLSTIRKNGVRSLLMGGQACILYGGAEFSRDTDIVTVADDENLRRLRAAVDELQAENIAVPPFERRFLEAGHAVHFRCRVPDAQGVRLDVMTKVRGLPDFQTLWNRRTTVRTAEETIEVLSLPDLVSAKKTQRDKDWPMTTRLVEAHYARHVECSDDTTVDFWLREARSPAILIDVASRAPARCRQAMAERPLLAHAIAGDESSLVAALRAEEDTEREADRRYWAPLKRELEALRRERRRDQSAPADPADGFRVSGDSMDGDTP